MKKFLPYLQKSITHYEFMGCLSSFVHALEPGANAILTLEGQNTTYANIFYAWVCIAWQLEKLLGNPDSGLVSLQGQILETYNHQFDQMMIESSHKVFLLGYWLHPHMCTHKFSECR